MRLLLIAAAALAGTLLPAAVAQAPPDAGEPAEALELHAVQQRAGAALHQLVEQALGAPDAPVPAPGPAAPPGEPAPHHAASAGPAPPAQPALHAARDLLLWLLAVGGSLGAAALGWRHLHARNVLDHPTRAAMLALVRARPGVHLHAVARAAGMPAQQAAYHLHTLERMGLVASQKVAGRRCYHAAGAAEEVRRALHDAAMGPAAQRVLDFVASNPGASQSEVARQLGMLPGAARWHLRRLVLHGTLVEAREGKALTYRSAPRAPRGPGQ